MARLDVHLPVLQRHAFEAGVDREFRVLPIFLLDHAGGNDALAMNGSRVAGALGSDCRAGLARCGKGVEIGRDPIFENFAERAFDLTPLQLFGMPEPVLAQGLMVFAAEDLDRTVVVNSAEDVVELDHAVEETPGNVTLQGSEEGINIYLVFHRFAGLRGKVDVGEIVVAGETELSQLKFFVRVHGVSPSRPDAGCRLSSGLTADS